MRFACTEQIDSQGEAVESVLQCEELPQLDP